MDWVESLWRALDYMETHLRENIGVEEAAQAAFLSPFYLQKGFKILTGYTVGEYLRCRRLYCAGLELVSGEERVIDLALRYGYDTPESFAKAFRRFHGCSPRQVREGTGTLRPFLPLTISITLQGGKDMDYKLEAMETLTLIGIRRQIPFESSYGVIPDFWDEFCQRCQTGQNPPDVQAAVEANNIGEFGLCAVGCPEDQFFDYWIAGIYRGGPVPKGLGTITLPALTWAKFRCVGPLPSGLQTVNTYLFKEWLPGNPEYTIAQEISLEWYSEGDPSAADYESGIWVPVVKKC